MNIFRPFFGFVAILACLGSTSQAVTIQFVPVGNPGNAADPTTGLGSVSYAYKIGEYDVTASQYAACLNAVAVTDTYGLYNTLMMPGFPTAGITQSGSPGHFTYSVTPGHENLPINYVSWGDAARFCNWLQNGQPTGPQGLGTTETGVYTLGGATTDSALMNVVRNPGAIFFIPTENEWYKAAYYKGGGANAGYWLYPTQNNTAPINTLPDTGNHANFYDSAGTGTKGYTNSPTRLTPVGAFSLSPGPYGAFDQAGNVFQWNEAVVTTTSRGIRGGSYFSFSFELNSAHSLDFDPTVQNSEVGFRVASVPEPSTGLLAALACGMMRWWRKRSKQSA